MWYDCTWIKNWQNLLVKFEYQLRGVTFMIKNFDGKVWNGIWLHANLPRVAWSFRVVEKRVGATRQNTLYLGWTVISLAIQGRVNWNRAEETSVAYCRGCGTSESLSPFALCLSVVHTRARAYAWHVHAWLPAFGTLPPYRLAFISDSLLGCRDCVSTLTVRSRTSIAYTRKK